MKNRTKQQKKMFSRLENYLVLRYSFTKRVACKRQSSVNSEAWLRRFDDITGVVKTDFFH